jgi:hypothetical protein
MIMKRAIFDLIKKVKLNSLVGGAIGKKNAMMNDNLNVCFPSVWFFFYFSRAARWFMLYRPFDVIYHKSQILAANI